MLLIILFFSVAFGECDLQPLYRAAKNEIIVHSSDNMLVHKTKDFLNVEIYTYNKTCIALLQYFVCYEYKCCLMRDHGCVFTTQTIFAYYSIRSPRLSIIMHNHMSDGYYFGLVLLMYACFFAGLRLFA